MLPVIVFYVISRLQNDPKEWGDVVDAIGVLVAIVAAIITYQALTLTRISAEAAKAAAEAATRQTESLRRTERGYLAIGFDEPKEWNEGGFGETWLCAINMGKTPVTLTRLAWYVMPDNEPFPPIEQFIKEKGVDAVLPIGSGERKRLQTRKLPQRSRHNILVVAEYKDIFEQSHRIKYARSLILEKRIGNFIGPPEWNSHE